MYISLDVLMRLGQLALIIAGVIAIIYVVLFLKSLMETFKTLQNTLNAVTRDLTMLESPLQTIDQVSNTVDEVHDSAKKAAMSAISVFSQGTEKLGGMLNKKKTESEQLDQIQATVNQTDQEVKADFQKVARPETVIVEETNEIGKGE